MSLASFPNCMANNTGVCAGNRWVVRFSLRSARFSASISCSCAHYHIKLQQRTHKTLIFLIKLFTPKRTSWPFQHFIHIAKAHTHTTNHTNREAYTSVRVRSIIVWFYFTIFACLFPLIFFWAFLFHQPCQCCLQCVFNKGMPCVQCAWF